MSNALVRAWESIKALTIQGRSGPAPQYANPPLSFGRDFRLYNRYMSERADDCENYSSVDPAGSSLVLSAVRWVGNTLPEAPAMVKEPTDADGNSEWVADHQLTNLLRYPNPYYAGDSLWTAFAYDWLISGNVYWIKVRDGAGRIAELWWEPAWSIRAVVSDKRALFSRGVVDGYEIKRGNLWYPIPVSDVIHFKDGLDPNNPCYGLSFIGSILRELYGDQEAARFAARLAGGGGVPPWVMTIDPAITFDQKAADELSEHMYDRTMGRNRGKPVVVYGGRAERLGFTPSEMDVKMLRRLPEERFCAVVGLPPEVLQLGAGKDHSIYNNMQQAVESAYDSYLIPLHRRIAAQLNLHLLPEFEPEGSGRYVAHDLSKVRALAEDEDALHARWLNALMWGVITVNEYRSKVGMAAIDDGEVYYVPSNMTRVKVGELDAEPEMTPDPLMLPSGDEENEEARPS